MLATVAFVLLAVVVRAGVSWYFSSKVLVPDHSNWPQDVTVEGLSPGRIVVSRSEWTERPGVYGLDWQAGHAVLGEVLGGSGDTVTR